MSENDIVQLKSYLKSNNILRSLCFCPLLMTYLISLYQELKGLSKFQTELVNKFFCIMILWILRNQQVPSILDITSLFEKLPRGCQNNMNKISKLAFYAIKEGKVVFESQKVFNKNLDELAIELKPSNCYQRSLGFVKVFTLFGSSGSKTILTLCFPLIQELLASFFVIQSGNNVRKLWAETEWSSKYINVWAFYFGLTKAVRKEFTELMFAKQLLRWSKKKLSSKILQDNIKCLYLVYCLMELPDEEIYQQAKEAILKNEHFLDLSNCNVTVEGLYVIISFLLCYVVRQWECFSISNCNLDDHALNLLQGRMKYIAKVKVFDLSSNQLTVKSVMGTFKIIHIMNASKVILSHNKNIKNKDICKYLVSHTKPSFSVNLRVVENDKTLFLMNTLELRTLQSTTTLTSLYIIRCSLDDDKMMTVLREHKTLSLVFLYDNKLQHHGLLKFFEGIKNLKNLKSLLIFEKTLPDANIDKISLTISESFTLIQVLLVSANKLLAQGATDHHILMALQYNPSIVHLQLNDCVITDEVMSKIVEMLNRSPQPWSLLDMSGNKVVDDTLRQVCDELDGNCAVNSINFASNALTSLSLIAELIQYLNPTVIDISKNYFTDDGSGMFVAERLFAHGKQFNLTLTCDDDNVLLCHKLDYTAIIISNNLTQLVIHNSTINGEMLLRSLDNNNTLTFMCLSHVKWSGEPLYSLAEFFKKDILFFICENIIPGERLRCLVNNFDGDVKVSRIIFAKDIFIANKCKYDVLKCYLTQKHLQLSSSANLFYARNCLLENEPQNCNIISDYFSKQDIMAEIVLCNNGLSQSSICRIIKTLQQSKLFQSIFICELHKQLYSIKLVRRLLNTFNCSRVVIDEKVAIGKQATTLQVDRCLNLVPLLTTCRTLQFINCNFGKEQHDTLADVLSHQTALEEFSLNECNTNSVQVKLLLDALQLTSTLTSLLLSCNSVVPLKADSIATALSTVIINNPTLEKVSFKFDNLPSSACGIIFQALSSSKRLKQFRFCDGQVTTDEAIHQLRKVISNNPSLEMINLKDNKLQSSGIKALSKAFKNICHLKLLALNGNQINEEAADDIASIIANNVEIEKFLLYNNSLKSKGICTVCQALKCHTNLQTFRINQNSIHEEAADDIADVIKHNQSLQVIDVASNRLLTKGVMKITESLENNLQKLCLSENNITCTEKAAASIARIIRNNKHLKALHLGDNNFSTPGSSTIANTLGTITNLQELTINNTGFTADHIAVMITDNLLLENLDIGDNKMKSEGVSIISKALKKLSCLKVLGLYGNEITVEAADDIAEVLYKLPVLEKLLLNNNAFENAGIKKVCESLQCYGALKLLQLDNVGITEEVAEDLVTVIHSNPLLEYLYLGNNKLQNIGVNVILKSLNNKKNFKALALNNNCASAEAVGSIVQFVTNNPELEELLLNSNSIGTAGVIDICKCIKSNNTLKVLSLTSNKFGDEAADAIISAITASTALDKISLNGNMLLMFDDDKLTATIAKLNSLQIDIALVDEITENSICKFINFVFANSNIAILTLNYPAKKIAFSSPPNTIATVIVFKVSVNEQNHMPELQSFVMENTVEIVCTKDDVLINSQIMKMVQSKTFQRLILVFTRKSCCTDQEISVLANTVINFRTIGSVIINKLNANEYNSDISAVVIIEVDKIIVMLTGDNLMTSGIIKLLHEIKTIKELTLIIERMSYFSDEVVDEIVDIISKTTKVEKYNLFRNATFVKGMETTINCLSKDITIDTVRILNNLNIRNFDFTQKSHNFQCVEEITTYHWHKILDSLKHNVDLKALNLFGTAINEDVACYLSFLLDKTTKLEILSLEDCSLGLNLTSVHLQKITTLKYLDLSNNGLTEHEPIAAILESNNELEKLFINKNSLPPSGENKLSVNINKLINLKVLNIDLINISKDMILKLTTFSSTATTRKLYIYNHDNQSTEVLDVAGSMHNTNTLTLCKQSSEMNNISSFGAVLKTGVVLLVWWQDHAMCKSEVIRLLRASANITTIKLLNLSGVKLTEQEEHTIATIVRENTQLENIWFGNRACKSVINDFHTFHSEHNNHIDNESNSKNSKNSKPMFISHELLFIIVLELKCYANLKTLNLSTSPNNAISEELVEQLANVIAKCIKLETLLLGNCSLGNKGVNVVRIL